MDPKGKMIMIKPISVASLPLVGDPLPQDQIWIELFNSVVGTPVLLNKYRRVARLAAAGIEEWILELEFPQRLNIDEEKRFRSLMAEAGWSVHRLGRTAEGNTVAVIFGRKNIHKTPTTEVIPDGNGVLPT